MGAQQSTGHGDGQDSAQAQIKTSYYELLGVERTATDDEIKKAYRRKALELHPDRNYGDVERTTALFADVSTAYEVLSDPQERTWYDAHEGDILRGGDGGGAGGDHYEYNMKVTTAEDISRMMGKFRSNVDFTDAPTGFFGFVRETFDQLADEEERAADYEGVSLTDYPSFGHKDDTFERGGVVRDFYNVWGGFATVKSFASMDKYRTADAPNRQIKRLMEKENKKLREEGIREFNAAVQNLVAFVRKRDPRYTPNTQTEEQKARAQRDARAQQQARARAANAAKIQDDADAVPDWAKVREPEELLEESEEEIEEEHFECVACRKTFKSERQWEAHEKSKKHQKAIWALKKKMQKDNEFLDLDTETDAPAGGVTPMDADDEHIELDPETELDADADADADALAAGLNRTSLASHPDSDPEIDTKTNSAPSPPNAKNTPSEDSDLDPASDSDSDPDSEYASRSDIEARLASYRIPSEENLSTSNTAPPPPPSSSSSFTAKNTPDITATPSTAPTDNTDNTTTTAPSLTSNDQPEDTLPKKKLGAAALKRAKKAAKQEAEAGGTGTGTGTKGGEHKCAKCGSGYASKTKLFDHLRSSGHAAPVGSVNEGGGGGKGKKGRR